MVSTKHLTFIYTLHFCGTSRTPSPTDGYFTYYKCRGELCSPAKNHFYRHAVVRTHVCAFFNNTCDRDSGAPLVHYKNDRYKICSHERIASSASYRGMCGTHMGSCIGGTAGALFVAFFEKISDLSEKNFFLSRLRRSFGSFFILLLSE